MADLILFVFHVEQQIKYGFDNDLLCVESN